MYRHGRRRSISSTLTRFTSPGLPSASSSMVLLLSATSPGCITSICSQVKHEEYGFEPQVRSQVHPKQSNAVRSSVLSTLRCLVPWLMLDVHKVARVFGTATPTTHQQRQCSWLYVFAHCVRTEEPYRRLRSVRYHKPIVLATREILALLLLLP